MKKLLGMNLSEILKSAVSESVDGIFGDEKLKQKQKATALKDFKAKKKSQKAAEDVDEAEEQDTSSGLKEPISPKTSDLPEITLPTIIDLIGAIRAGQSLKDKTVATNLKDYFTRLNGNERVALYAFLTGISKVMSQIDDDNKDGAAIATPDADPYKINMKKTTPKVDKAPPKGEEAPIVVGESANIYSELKILKRNAR